MAEVVGYLMSKLTCFPENSYCIVPFYADSSPIAQVMLCSILENEIGTKPTDDLIFMCDKELPNKCPGN